LCDYKFETFIGKAVCGSADVELENLMDVAKEASLAWVVDYNNTGKSMAASKRGDDPSPGM
jgi:hypothetical protein